MMEKIKIGISACLLGENVRWDGENKQDRYLTDTLGRYLEFVPVCPETECGLGVPRDPLRLEGDPVSPRLVCRKTGVDLTDRVKNWAEEKMPILAGHDLCGFIFKSKSPSCGMERLPVYSESGPSQKKGHGIFANIFMQRFPRIPVEEDGRLHDPKLRENFIEALFTLKRWRAVRTSGKPVSALVDFHTRNKMLILSHNQDIYRKMGALVARGASIGMPQLHDQYERLLTDALRLKTTVKKNINVLMHMMGYFKKNLTPDEKQELLALIDQYKNGAVPLIVPVTMINHYARKYDQAYLKMQTYLTPHPVALKLRNHA